MKAASKGQSFQQFDSSSSARRDYSLTAPVSRPYGALAARRLKIYAFDPQLGRRRRYRIQIEVPYEELVQSDGFRPWGRVVKVVDYDAYGGRYYDLVNLEDPKILAGGGLEPKVDDHRFHQQMVYAVCMKVAANFERALGRKLRFTDPVSVLPHAMWGENAFFDAKTNSISFGYFKADMDDPGSNLPGQWIFTCLSHDIIAHEMAHAIIHRLRPHFVEPTNPDVYAFHEAVADIVAIFQRFAFPGVLEEAIQAGRADLRTPGALTELARQFGHSTGSGAALRAAVDRDPGRPLMYSKAFEPHHLGSVLVLAVFEAFFNTYSARTEDLIRLATGGSGVLPEGALSYDLVSRLSEEAADTAQRVLDLCIRAFDYLPPIDVTFGDFLRALVTADTELNPEDPYDLRANLVDSFLARGIHPDGVFSLNEESLLWEAPSDTTMEIPPVAEEVIDQLSAYEARKWGTKSRSGKISDTIAQTLHAYATDNAAALGLNPSYPGNIRVQGFHSMFRVGDDGQLLTEVGVQFVQTPSSPPLADLGGVIPRAGTTVIFSGDGFVRFIISKPLRIGDDHAADPEDARLVRMQEFVERCDERDPAYALALDDGSERMGRRFSFALLHQTPGKDLPERAGNPGSHQGPR